MRKDDDDDEKWNVEKIEDIKYLFDSVFPPFDDAPSLPPRMSQKQCGFAVKLVMEANGIKPQ